MADRLVNESSIVSIADAIRSAAGITDKMIFPEGFVSAIENMGGVKLPELTNPGSASDLLYGKELINEEGEVVTGIIESKSSSDLTASGPTITAPAGYYASDVSKSVTTKTSNDLTANGAVVTLSEGYYDEGTSKSVATTTQATPTISVSTAGVITASSTQEEGYVEAGTTNATKSLTTKAATTITPGTSNKTAVAKNVYTTGAITVKGDSNLIASNIKNGTSIFGIKGTYAPGPTDISTVFPTITVDSSGKITAETTLESAYYEESIYQNTKQLTTQAAKTVTPGTSNKTAVAKNVYTTGAITVKGDSNLIASNIKNGISIFNVTGTLNALPSKFSEIKTGSFTVASDTSGGYNVTHGLSSTADFFICYPATIPTFNYYNNYLCMAFGFFKDIWTISNINGYIMEWYMDTGIKQNCNGIYFSSAPDVSTTFPVLDSNSKSVLKASTTYYWIAGTFA